MRRISLLINCWRCQQIFVKHYEPHNHQKCKKQVWKQYAYPKSGVNYATFLRYLDEDVYPLVKAGIVDEREWKRVCRKMEMIQEAETVPA